MGSQRPLALALDAVDVLGLASPCSPSWASVVKGRKIFFFPLYDSSGIGGDDIPLTNFFSPLTELPQEPVLSPIISSTAHGPIYVRPTIRKCPTLNSLCSLSLTPGPPGCKRLSPFFTLSIGIRKSASKGGSSSDDFSAITATCYYSTAFFLVSIRSGWSLSLLALC